MALISYIFARVPNTNICILYYLIKKIFIHILNTKKTQPCNGPPKKSMSKPPFSRNFSSFYIPLSLSNSKSSQLSLYSLLLSSWTKLTTIPLQNSDFWSSLEVRRQTKVSMIIYPTFSYVFFTFGAIFLLLFFISSTFWVVEPSWVFKW